MKKVIAFALILAMILCFAACGGSEPKQEETVAPYTEEPTEAKKVTEVKEKAEVKKPAEVKEVEGIEDSMERS